MLKEDNKFQIDIENLFKQNVNDLSAIKELYRKLKEVEEKITQIKYIDSTLAYKLKKEYEKLKRIILDENVQAKLSNDIESINEKLTNDIDTINEKLTNNNETINSQLDTIATNKWCKGGFWNVCHKGGVLCCSPQNSLEGIEKAYEFGYKAIEVDIGITVDGKWICFHDETVDYLTDGEGKYYTKTWKEIQKLNYDQGTGGNTTLLKTFYFPVKIPLFEDFLKKANEYNMCVALDVRGFTTYTDENIKDLIDIIKKYDMEKRVVIWGVDFPTVRKYSYHIAISFSSTTQSVETIYNELKPFLPNVMNNRIDVYYTKEIISELHQCGIKCAVGFPGNGEKDANDIVDKWRDEYGMDYLIVDNYLYNEGGIK